ncbi:competence type IV pilus minor pilin ComGG [Vagococcus fluvialis]|uniref:competence type IV pilus minor pilin ComGG n=1 Tax=Vagococcus fluvialis TaxID=2738 RepID=UPI001A8D8DCF|nr:competence type IV pilus minor pilin ComGG [Vagococcus fluvialis]MBO0437700.1 hypothetical protein [Vagococcus fluvialis]
MRKKNTAIFYFLKNKQGGVLFPVLTILFMFTLLLLYVTDDYFSRREMLVNTRDFYLAKTMEEISLLEITQQTTEENKVFIFNIGESTWEWNKEKKNYLVQTSLSNQYKRTSIQELRTKR